MHKSPLLLRPQILGAGVCYSRHAQVTASSVMRNISSSQRARKPAAVEIGYHGSQTRAKSSAQDNAAALSKLPLAHVVRSYLITSMSSSNLLLNATMGMMQRMLRAKSAVFDPSRNPMLNWFLRRSFYDQFCAGENKAEIGQTIDQVHRIGYTGIILEYAPEVTEDEDPNATAAGSAATEKAIETWKQGMIDTVSMVEKGDFVGLKWSGMGSEALRLLKQNQPPSQKMAEAMAELCDAAAAKGVRLLPAAEPQNANAAVDAWSLELASRYNKAEPNSAVVYGTYQCYLKSTAQTLAKHLAYAAQHDFTLGIKLVRGAYLETEQRNLIWDTKEETDKCYDTLATAILERKYGDFLEPAPNAPKAFPDVNIMLATHNQESVENAQEILDKLSPGAQELVRLDYAQLQGMADEVSCALLATQSAASKSGSSKTNSAKVYKCITWGTTTQCLDYLIRRASENRDALSRTVTTRKAMGKELLRRFRSVFGLG